MRPCLVEVRHICIEDALKLLLMEDEQMIEALTSHTAQEALTDGIGMWSVIRGFENLDATRLGNLSEAHTKLAIIIPDEVFRTYNKGGGFPNRYVLYKCRWESVSRRRGSLCVTSVR
jgi:hypothetical protein